MSQTQLSELNLIPTTLKRGARRLAKKSANRLSAPAVARELVKLNRLFETERNSKLEQGDTLVALIDDHQLRPIDIARATKTRANHLSEMYLVATAFPPKVRRSGVPYTHYWMAMRAVRRFKDLTLSPRQVLSEITKKGFTQHREVTAHFAARIRYRENARTLARSVELPAKSLNRCYHARFQSLLDVFPDHSIKIVHADVPYANYRRIADGRYSGGSITRMDCDSATAAESIELTIDLLRDWGPKIKTGGVLLLWQAAGPLRRQIADAIDAHGWTVDAVAIWDKGHIQAGNFESPYSTQTEWLWILKRSGDKLINHNNSSRGDILRFQPVRQSAATAGHAHAFEKPLDLCEFLVAKHSFEGDLIFDLCACTGTMSVAAANMNRRWVYCESHIENFKVGSERVSRALHSLRKTAG